MIPIWLLASCWLLFRLVGRLGIPSLDSGAGAGRAALAVMFGFTGITHFTGMRVDYLAMIPPPLPRHLGLIYLTGVLELAGGVGLLIPRVRRSAALGLFALLLAMFPANVYATIQGIPFRGAPPTSLWLRAPVQLVLLAAVWWTAARRHRSG